MEQPSPQSEPQTPPEAPRHPELPPPFQVLPYKPSMPPLTQPIAEKEAPRVSRGSHLKLKLIMGIILSAIGSWVVMQFKLYKVGRFAEDVVQVNRSGHAKPHMIQKQKEPVPASVTPTPKKTSKTTSSKKSSTQKSKRKPWLGH